MKGQSFGSSVAFVLALVCGCTLQEKEKQIDEVAGSGGTGGDDGSGGPQGGTGGGNPGNTVVAADCDDVEPLPQAIEEDLTIGPGCVRIDRLEVNGDATLTIEPGTRVEFAPGGFLSVARYGGSATVAALGTEEQPITFTSSNANPRAGDWQCIHLDGDGSELDHVVVE
jgi:hypothetical protein